MEGKTRRDGERKVMNNGKEKGKGKSTRKEMEFPRWKMVWNPGNPRESERRFCDPERNRAEGGTNQPFSL